MLESERASVYMYTKVVEEESVSVESPVFYRNVRMPMDKIVRGEGVYLYDDQGRRYLDAVGGTSVGAIGPGVKEIYEAVGRQAPDIVYAYNGAFPTPWQEDLARPTLSVATANMRKAYF